MSNDIKLSPKYGLNPTIPICFWCGQEKDEVALMGKLGDSRKGEDIEAPKHCIVNYDPCDKCKELFDKGIHVIGVTNQPIVKGMYPMVDDGKQTLYPTGSMFVGTEDWAVRFLTVNQQETMIEDVLSKKVLLLPDELVVDMIKESKAKEMEVNIPEDLKEEVQSNEDN